MLEQINNIKIIAGNSNLELSKDIAAALNTRLVESNVTNFSDGEINVHISETIRGEDVFVVQSICKTDVLSVNDSLVELLIIIDALKRASAGRITAVIPYYGYARQDRKAKSRDPITAKLVADIMTVAGAHRVLTMDLHAPQIQGYFNIPVDHLFGLPVLVNYYDRKIVNEDVVVVSPDVGSVKRARSFADRLNGEVPIAIIDKRRPTQNVCEVLSVIGEVNGKIAILVDDMIDTAGTIVNAAVKLKELGTKEIYACCTHGVFSGSAIEKINKSPIKELVFLNTIFKGDLCKNNSKFKMLSVAPIFGEAIKRIHHSKSLSPLFGKF